MNRVDVHSLDIEILNVGEGQPPPLTAESVAAVLYLSLVGTGLAFVLWFNGIRRLPPPRRRCSGWPPR